MMFTNEEKNPQTIANEISKILIIPKRKPIERESDRGKEFYKSAFPNFLKFNIKNHYPEFTDKGPSIAERIVRNMNFVKNWFLKKKTLICYVN